MATKTSKSDHCLNCGHALTGENFCPNCGQRNDDSRLTLRHVLSESLSNLLAFDGRFFKTIFTLFRHPGKVPLEFIRGKRTYFMNPVRIYFLSSLLLLSLMQITKSTSNLGKINVNRDTEQVAETDLKIKADSASSGIPINASVPSDEAPAFMQQLGDMSDFYISHKNLHTGEALDSMALQPTFYNKFMYAQAAKVANFDQEEFNEYLFSKMFWVLFLFVPVLALLLKLLYIRRKFYYPEHLFFSFYTQSVFFLLLAIIVPIEGPSENMIAFIIFIGFGVYLLLSLKQFYGQGWGKTILKFVFLNLLLTPALAVFFVLSAIVVFLIF